MLMKQMATTTKKNPDLFAPIQIHFITHSQIIIEYNFQSVLENYRVPTIECLIDTYPGHKLKH